MIGYGPAGIVRNAPTEYSSLFVPDVDDLVILGYGDRRDGSLMEKAEDVFVRLSCKQTCLSILTIFLFFNILRLSMTKLPTGFLLSFLSKAVCIVSLPLRVSCLFHLYPSRSLTDGRRNVPLDRMLDKDRVAALGKHERNIRGKDRIKRLNWNEGQDI